ncbi:MAG: aminotransferase class V-fold PLP-dependent enzyme [Pseudomonadota bacterium]
MSDRIYLDHAATSPLRPEAKRAMEEGFRLWSNPSSPHAEGRRAKQALEDARERIKRALGWEGELIFTSGASEALWIALNRSKAKRRIVSAVEHDAVFRAAPDAEVLRVRRHDDDRPGEVILASDADFSDAVVAIQQINPETGAVQPVAELIEPVRERGGLLLCDCSQSAGKLVLPKADMVVVSAHKFGGPIGIGALLVADYNALEPMGGHERGYRQGTENLPTAMAMAAAIEQWDIGPHDFDHVHIALRRFGDTVYEAGGQLIGDDYNSGYISAITHPTLSAQALLIRLDAMGFAVSAGSACSSGTLKKSRVLDAFGVPDDVAARTIRVSLGWSTTAEELERFVEAWRSLC